jgi:cell division protein ZapE
MTMGMSSYYYPTGSPEVKDKLSKVWANLADGQPPRFENVQVAQGRFLPVQKSAKNVAEFNFAELCDDARAGPDYQAICDRYNCLILRKVPVLDMKRRDRMRRFILLIDILYYNHIDVYIEADVPVEEIFNIKDTDIVVESNTEIWER